MSDEVPSIFDPGVVTLITGRMGTGKTDMALMFAELGMKRKGLTILTNIIMHETVPGVIQTTRASEMLREIAKENQYLTILDEAGLFANSKQIKSKPNMDLVKLILVIRKFRSAVFFINQRDMETAKTIRELSQIEFHKESKKTLRMFADFKNITMYNIPRTTLPFDTRAIAYFKMDVDIDTLFADLSNMPYKQAMKKLREIADKDFEGYRKEGTGGAVEKIPKSKILKVIAEAHPEWGTSELAKVVGVTDRYVRDLRAKGQI